MKPHKIAWTEATYNPITGCTKISEGCANCFAERMAKRLAGRCGYDANNPFKVTLHEDKLLLPMRWKKPRMVFVGSMGDLFHKDVPDEWIDRVMAVIASCPQHTFQILTKRPERMQMYFGARAFLADLPLANLWLGTSAENQRWANERIPHLLRTPASVRFLSLEPLLGPVDFNALSEQEWNYNALTGLLENPFGAIVSREHGPHLDWVIVGCESGPGRRPCKIEWVEDIVRQCAEAGVPCFVKQIEINGRVSHDPAEWPAHLRVQQWPKTEGQR